MGADLNNIVKTQKLSDEHVQFLVYQILRGMKYVHSAGIIHRVNLHNNLLVFRFLIQYYIYIYDLAAFLTVLNLFGSTLGSKAFKHSCE